MRKNQTVVRVTDKTNPKMMGDTEKKKQTKQIEVVAVRQLTKISCNHD
jgi:hypothetical protein